MEQLIIFLLVALGSAISGYVQNKKKREAERSGHQPPSGEAPIPHWPKTPKDWQEELRRLLQGQNTQGQKPSAPAPPKLPTPTPAPVRRMAAPRAQPERSEGAVVFQNPLVQSSAAYQRASQLAGRVEQRLQAVDAQTTSHKPSPIVAAVRPSANAAMNRWTSNRESLREAFIASLIFSPPLALQGDQLEELSLRS